MLSIEKQIETLSDLCFDIESQLRLFSGLNPDNQEQSLRRGLYRIRIEIGALKRSAQMVDEEREAITNAISEVQLKGERDE